MEEATVRLPLRVLADTNSAWSLAKWLVSVGDSVYINQRVAILRSVVSNSVDHALAPRAGKLVSHVVEEGERISNAGPDTPIARIEYCPHNLVFKGLCCLCGEDVSTVHFADVGNAAEESRLPVAYTSKYNLTMTRTEARSVASAAVSSLLKTRRLSLVLDLDHTLVHATDDPRAGAILKFSPSTADFASIKSFSLPPTPAMRNSGRPIPHCNMYIKLRPHLLKFLARLSKRFELSIYTMGTRQYADQIVKIIDPDRRLFGGRITSREDFSEGKLNQKNLERVFPVDDSMVLIVDDREDVWISGTGLWFMPNLLKAKPYYFWSGFSEAYDRASSTAAPAQAKKAEVLPMKVSRLEAVKPKPMDLTLRSQENEGKVLPNAMPLDLTKLLETVPTSASEGKEQEAGVKSLPFTPAGLADAQIESGVAKPSYKRPKGTGVKSLPNPVPPARADDSCDGDPACKETGISNPEPASDQTTNGLNKSTGANGHRNHANGDGKSLAEKENEMETANGSRVEEMVLDDIPIPRKNKLPGGNGVHTSAKLAGDIPIPRKKKLPVRKDADNAAKLLVGDVRIPRKKLPVREDADASTSGKSNGSNSKSDDKPTGSSPGGANNTDFPDKTESDGTPAEDAALPEVPANGKENINGSANSTPKTEPAPKTEPLPHHGLNSELRATVHKWWAQEEASPFNAHLLRLADVLERCHEKFFQIITSSPRSDAMSDHGANVKGVLSEMRKTVFAGCVFTFTGVFPLTVVPEESVTWNFAARYGARCSPKYESGVTTHVIAAEARGLNTEKTSKALAERTAFVVNTDWLEDSMVSWERLPELPYSLHAPPEGEVSWEDYRADIDTRRRHTYASVLNEMQKRAPKVDVAELKIAAKRDASGVTHEDHLAKRAKMQDSVTTSEEGDETSAGRVLSGDELNDALGELLDI